MPSINHQILSFAACIIIASVCVNAQFLCPVNITIEPITQILFTEFTPENPKGADALYAMSLSVPLNETANDNTAGCAKGNAYVTRYINADVEDEQGCSFYAETAPTATPTPTGCLYQLTANDGSLLNFNISCDQTYQDHLDMDFNSHVSEVNGKRQYDFNGYLIYVCDHTTLPTPMTSPTTQGPTTPTTTSPRIGVDIYTQYGQPNNVIYFIEMYLNVFGTVSATCGNADATGNYTCLALFNNYTQAVQVVYGINHGQIKGYYNATFVTTSSTTEGPTTSFAPMTEHASTTTTTSTTQTPTTTLALTDVTIYTNDDKVVAALESYLNITSQEALLRTAAPITASCSNADSTGNYTCLAQFTNSSQAAQAIYGINHGYLKGFNSAHLGTPAPSPTTSTPGKKDNGDGGRTGAIVGAVIGSVVFISIVAVGVVFYRPKNRGAGDYTDINHPAVPSKERGFA